MKAQLLDGKALAQSSEAEFCERVRALKKKNGGIAPILATILVGDDPASATYVRMKGNACSRIGLESLKIELPAETTTEQLLTKIEELNENPSIHGVLLQHPVPKHIDERRCFDAIHSEKGRRWRNLSRVWPDGNAGTGIWFLPLLRAL